MKIKIKKVYLGVDMCVIITYISINETSQWRKKMSSYEQYAKKYFGQLKGYTIIHFKLEKEDDMIFPVFIMKKANNIIKVSVSQDEEGNGGGHLFIEEAIQ